LSDRVVFAAAFHGSKLAPENDDGPHRHFAGKTARMYVGIAAGDPTFGAVEEGRLAAAFREAGINHVIETYAGAAHGFVMDDLPVFNATASNRHWQRLSTELREAFVARNEESAS
jgi:carboxymethylenebutenolidase